MAEFVIPDGPRNPPVQTREETLSRLSAIVPALQKDCGITHLQIFGSASRDELTDKSDVDVLAHFDEGGVSFDRYFDVKERLEQCLGRPIDLLTPGVRKPRLFENIQGELQNVA